MTTPNPSSSASPAPTAAAKFAPGTRLRITQQIVRQGNGMGVGAGDGTFTGAVEGIVVMSTQQKTGSWYAHSRDGKLWLDRIELKKDDGELITLNIDQYTHIDVL